MDAVKSLYESGLSMREVARRTGITFQTVRSRLVKSGLFRATHKGVCNGMATCRRCNERKTADQFPYLVSRGYLCRACLQVLQEVQQLRRRGSSNEAYQSLLETQDSNGPFAE